MFGDDTARDVQAQTHAGESSVVDVTAAMETLEDERLILERNADALVRHTEARLVPVAPQADVDRLPVRAVLERILDQIRDHLIKPGDIHGRDHGSLEAEVDALP